MLAIEEGQALLEYHMIYLHSENSLQRWYINYYYSKLGSTH
ncbi:hypothetical protein ERAQ111492_00590 [Erysipelothrix aquatica]